MLRLQRLTILALLSVWTAACVSSSGEKMPEGFVDAASVVPDLVVDMRYAGSDNFVGRPVDGYEAPVCILTVEAAEALAEAQAELGARSLGLKVFDCYRPTRAVADFVRWAQDEADTKTQAEFYPDLEKSELFGLGYIAERSGHSRGSTVDLTLVYLPDETEAPMGTGFDFFSERSWTTDPEQPAEVRTHRLLLLFIMQRHGFEPYENEWWHFTLADEPFPDTYFDFPVR
ncbi:MAG: M15 family metallopeptidase [Acidobacteria bacterium]|nr:M15 family metallopeptidase [Acidobacteriota bacterium]